LADDVIPRERRLAIGLLAQPSLRHVARLAHDAEQRGYSAAFIAETVVRRDAISAITAMALATTRLKIGSAAINVYTRGAALLAVTWAALAEAAPGRTILGLGVGSASTLAVQGFDVSLPIARLREYTEAIRLLWSGEEVSYSGRCVTLDNAQLEVRPDPPPDIYYCVGGPQALRTAARQADGIVLDAFLSTGEVTRMIRQIHGAAASRFSGEIGTSLMVSIADDWRDAADRLRPTVASYISRFPELAREMGLSPELIAQITVTAETAGLAAAASLVDYDVVDALAVCGSPDRCRRRIEEYRTTGVTLPVLVPEPLSLERVIADLAPVPD
jgi:5,10-methylenetetrahydromethanopterin reductase